MKKRSNFRNALLAVALLLSLSGKAQLTLIPPVQLDNPWYTSIFGCPSNAPYIAGINTAMIDYPMCANPPCNATGTLIVSDYYGNGTNGGVVFTDLLGGAPSTIQIDYCVAPPYPGAYMANSPDIIVGNDLANPLTDYNVAVVYVGNYPSGAGMGPIIDYYHVHYTGPFTFAVNYVSSTCIMTGGSSNCIHIDVISEQANTATTGMPWCDQFVVTWDDWGAPGGPSVYGYYSALNAPHPPILPVGAGTFIDFGINPDVAGIQRAVTCATCPSPMGLFTYTDQTAAKLMYGEWQVGGPVAAPIYSYASGPYDIYWPRIDANDNFMTNMPTPFKSFFKVCAQVYVPGSSWTVSQSLTFDNVPFFAPQDDGYFIPAANPQSPTVAFGGNNNTQYQVSHYTYAPGPFNVWMEPINVNLPWSPLIPDFCPSTPGNDFYAVNLFPPMFLNGNYLNAISTPCNNTADLTLVTWAWFDPGAMISRVFYKATHYGPPNPNGYQFRQAGTPAATTQADWKVFPNPATTTLNIVNPGEAGRYEVTDVLGRNVLSGELAAGSQSIDVLSLMPGTYNIAMYKGNERACNQSFVKQ